MSTPSKNSVNEDDDDQDYIPVGILQLSSIRQPIHLETQTEVASHVSYNEKQHKDLSFHQTPSQLEQHEVGNFEKGQGRRRSNPHQSQVAEDDIRNLPREEVKQDPLQQYKILLQYMQQQKAQANNDELRPNLLKSQGKVRSSTLLPNASPSGSYENQRQSQDLNSNVPVESKNQLLKILTLGQKDLIPASVPGSVFVSHQSEEKQNRGNVIDDSNSNIEIQGTILHGHIEQNTLKHREDPGLEYEPHRLSNSVLRIDISNSHIPKSSVEQILHQSPTSLAASNFNAHLHVNHQHPEISKRLNSPVSPGRQSTSPRQAISPRQAGSPRQISNSPCQFVSPKQPVSPRGTIVGPWKSQPSSPQSFQPPSPRALQVTFPWQPSSPSLQTIPTRKSYDNSTALNLPSPIPQLPVSFSSSAIVTHNKVSAQDVHHHHPSRFQPIRCSPSQVSYSGGIVHHRPLLDALHNPSNLPAQFDPSPSKVALTSTQASVPQHTSFIPRSRDSSVSMVRMSKQKTDSENEMSTLSQQCHHNSEMVDQPTALTSLPSSQDSSVHKGNNFVKPGIDTINSEQLRESSSIDHGEGDLRQCDNDVSHRNKCQQNIGDDGINEQFTKSSQDHDGDDKESLASVETCSKTEMQKTDNYQTRRSESKKLLHQRKDVEKSGEIQENVDKQDNELSPDFDEKSLKKSEGITVELIERCSKSNFREGTGKHLSTADGQDSEGSSSVSDDTQKEKESGKMISGREASSKRQRKPKVPFENSSVSSGKVKKNEKVDDGSQQRKVEWKMSKQEKPQVRKGSSLRMQSILTRSGLRLKGSQMNTKSMSTGKNVRNNRGQFIKNSMARSDLRSTKRLVAKKGNVKEPEKNKKMDESGKEPEKNKRKRTENGQEYEKNKKKGIESDKEPEKDKKKGVEKSCEPEKNKKKGTENGKEPEKDKKKQTESSKEPEKDKKKATESVKESEKDRKKATESVKESEKDRKKGTESGKEPEKDRKKGTESGKEPEKDRKKATESGKESEKDRKKATESVKEPEKDRKKATESGKEPEKDKKKGTEISKATEKEYRLRSLDQDSNSSKETDMNVRSSSRLLARQSVAAVDKNKDTPPSKLKNQSQESPKLSNLEPEKRVTTTTSTRSLKALGETSDIPEKPSTRGMTTRQSDGTRKTSNKRPFEFLESLPFSSRKRTKSEEVTSKESLSSDKNNAESSEVRSTTSTRSKSKSGSVKDSLETDEDEEYKIEDDEDDEEDSSDDRIIRTTTRSRRFRFPERKISMNLRGEARKRKYNLVDQSSSDESDDDDDDDKDSDDTDEEELDESETERDGLPGKNIENLIAMAKKEEIEGNSPANVQTQDTPGKTEPTLVTADLSKLAAFKLVPLSPEEMAGISGSELVLPLNGFVLPGTNNIFFPPHCIQHLKTETDPNVSSSNAHSHSKAVPCSRVLVTPRPISSVTDSSTKASAFSSPSSSSPSKISSSTVPSSKPWNSPFLPTPPPSVSSSSSSHSSSSSSWNPVANLPWVPENSSTCNNDPAANESWRKNNGYLSRGSSYGNNLTINTDNNMPLMPNSVPLPADHDSDPTRNDRMLQGLFREASNLSPSSYNIALPGLGQQDISYLESNLQQDMDISSSMLLSEVPYEDGIHESVSVHHDASHLVCSVNLDDADGLGSATPTLHLPGSSLENISVPQPPPPPPPPHQQQVGVMALKDRNISLREKMVLEDGGGQILQKDDSNTDVNTISVKSTEKSLMNTRRHLYDICIVDDKKMGKCRVCGNTYSLTSIYRHLRKHDSPNYNFSCDVCGKKYSQKHHLLVHMKKVHGSSSDGELQHDGARNDEKSSEADVTKLKHWTSSESQPTRKSTPHSATETDKQIESNTNSGRKDSKKKAGKRSVERKFSKEGLVYEQMPESPNAISLESKREARRHVERFRRMKARNKFAARNDMSGITLDISQLDSDTTDDEENIKGEKGINSKDNGETETKSVEEMNAENIKAKEEEQFGNEENSGNDFNESINLMQGSLGTDLGKNPMESMGIGQDTGIDESSKNKHPCSLCNSVLASRCSYLMHMRRHNNAKDKFCTYCGKGFITSQELRSHERTHTGERPFACEICKLTFAHSGSCQAHKKGHFRKGETVPFPPEKCYNDGKLPLRGKRRAASDGAEKQDIESESESIPSSQNVSETETNTMRNDTSSIEFRRRSADSGPLQQNLKHGVSEMGPPWPIPSSDNFSWKNRSSTEHDKRQIVTLESNVPHDHRGQVQHRPGAVNFRDQTSPPFYSPTHYMSTGESPMMSPNARRTSSSPSQKFSTHYSSPAPVSLNTHVKSPSQDPNFPGNQGYCSRDESRQFVTPVSITSGPRPQMHASPSPQNVTSSNYSQSPQQYMFHPSNSSPNYSQQVQKHHTPQHHSISMQEQSGGEMVKNYMSPYHSLSSPSYPGSSQMDYSVNQQGLAVDRSPLHTPSQPSQPPTMHPNQQMQQRHQQQHSQRQQQQVPLYHQPGTQHQQFQQHHHPSDLQHQTTHKPQQQPPQQATSGRHLQQLLTQQPPPPYTSNKPTPPPPYPSGITYNEFYHSPQQQRDKSQTPRKQEDSFQSKKIPPQQHSFINTAFTNSSHFQTGSSSQTSAISVIRSIQSAAADNSPTPANFGQPIRVPPGQMNTSAYSSSSPTTPQPYQHHPSPSSSTPSPGYFHQGPS